MPDLSLYYPNESNKKKKKSSTIPKRLTKQEQAKIIKGLSKHPALKLVLDHKVRNEIIFGDIKWPDAGLKKLTSKKAGKLTGDELKKAKFAWVAEATGYVAMHLERWSKEEIKGNIAHLYKTHHSPFTLRLFPIEQPCEDLLDFLPGTLPAFQQRFREKYEYLKKVASKADSSRIQNRNNSIYKFKSASVSFRDTVLTIHSEALEEVITATKPAETGRKEIVEVKPGAFGITVNIKEIARCIWRRVCYRRKG